MSARRCGKSQPTVAREGFLDRRSKRCFWLLLSPQTKVARAGARNSPCAGCGRDEGVLRRCAATPHPPPSGAPVSLRVGRFAGLTRHRRVIQYRGPLKGKANVCGDTSSGAARHLPLKGKAWEVRRSRGRLDAAAGREKKEPPCGRLPFFFSAFWRCRSGPSGTGETGHRRGLRRGRRSWENPWHRRP